MLEPIQQQMSVAKECTRQGSAKSRQVYASRRRLGNSRQVKASRRRRASREAPVDNECLGQCRQVYASLGKSTTTGKPGLQAIKSWARQV